MNWKFTFVMHCITFFLLVWSFQIHAQSQTEAIILDAETRMPLEFVDVYNSSNYTSTNSDGRFQFTTSADSIKFNRLGYHSKAFVISAFKKDTVYLSPASESLAEVHVIEQSIYKKMIAHLEENYPITPYKERFFLRATVKNDGHITKLADLNGKLERKRLIGDMKTNERPNKNYTIEIENLRKAAIMEDDIDFVFPSFERYLDLASTLISFSDSTKVELSNYGDHLVKLQAKSTKNDSEAYLIINTKDYAVEESFIKMSYPDAEFEKGKGTESRDRYNIFHSFYKALPNGKYVLTKNMHKAAIECRYKDKLYTYVQNIQYRSSDHFADFDIKRNVRAHKDIFKVKTSYAAGFWNDQNQLLLTDAMKAFIEKVKVGDSDFKIKSNF
ncbi:hypothetical protein [Zunongwangia endophytica]|uniref:CarboxypepD_reg-like domain-containing protein n=1 Tax=Zunongwangia endophytica TaxID=1808945 RepID=A0ABV8H547_9FLAO|nr:hypothetical protein [Zunongwangia endophytica]MDN3595277.1 hypothetical protein [Zunongwangia endophytica]